MREKSKVVNVCLASLAAGLVLTAGVGSANAYFTTYAEAKGGIPIQLGDRNEIEERLSEWTKHVVITSEADSEPVWVRATAFHGSDYTLTYSDASGKWGKGDDGYYYYNEIVYAGEKTETLDIKISGADPDAETEFNVIVIYECTPVRYDEDGNALEPNWDEVLDSDWNPVSNGGEG